MTHVITGDIPAMWLRDSAAQLRPYIFLASENEEIRELIAGLVRRHLCALLLTSMPMPLMKLLMSLLGKRLSRSESMGVGAEV